MCENSEASVELDGAGGPRRAAGSPGRAGLRRRPGQRQPKSQQGQGPARCLAPPLGENGVHQLHLVVPVDRIAKLARPASPRALPLCHSTSADETPKLPGYRDGGALSPIPCDLIHRPLPAWAMARMAAWIGDGSPGQA